MTTPVGWDPLGPSGGGGAGSGSALPLLHVRDEKASGTASGSFTAGSWVTRDLNTTLTSEIAGASLATNLITLPAGSYEVEALAPGFACGRHRARLYNVTGAASLVLGQSAFSSAGATSDKSPVRGRFTLGVESAVRLEHRCDATSETRGLGVESNFAGVVEVYAEVLIRKTS